MANTDPFAVPGSTVGAGGAGPFGLAATSAGYTYPKGFSEWLFNSQPGAGLAAFQGGSGLGGGLGDPFGRYLNQNLPTLYNQYTVATTQNPSLNFTDWLAGQGTQLRTGYELERPNFQRAIQPRRFLG
jgi:hypothetical protein